MKKYITIIMIICAIYFLVGCSGGKTSLDKYDYFTGATVKNGEDTYEINKCLDEDLVIITKNNKIIKEIKTSQYSKNKEIMEFTGENERLNINEKRKTLELTWEADIVDAEKYINYLKSKGYTIEFQANTEEFIELYLKNPDNDNKEAYKRIIIDGKTITEVFIKQILFSDIENYIN